MRSSVSTFALLLLVLVCFGLGLASALAPRSAATPTATIAPGPAPVPDAGGQTTLLVVGVDDLHSPQPALRAVWLISFRTPGKDLFALGLPTHAAVPVQSGFALAELFAWDREHGVDAAFLAGLQRLAPLQPSLVLCMDRTAFAALIDYLGGLDLNGVRLSGVEAVAVLDLLADDPAASLATQARLLEALALRAPQAGATPDLTPLIDLIPDHVYLSSSLAEAAAALAPLLPIEPTALHFDLPPVPTAPLSP